MKSFNADRKYSQQLQILQSKYGYLTKNLSEGKKENITNLLADKYGVMLKGDTIQEKRENLKTQGIMEIFGQIPVERHKEFINEIFEWEMDSLSKKVFLADVQRYLMIKKEKENEGLKTIEREPASRFHKYIEQNISSQLRDALVEKDKLLQPEKLENLDDSQLEEDFQGSLSQLLREKVVDQIVYFHAIQSIYRKYNYILTLRDIWTLKSMLKDLSEGRMIFLSGDTGSGKTELALLASKLYLELRGIHDKKRAPVLVSGSKETTVSDLTIEKNISSENMMSVSDDDLVWGERGDKYPEDKLIDLVKKKQSLKRNASERIDTDEQLSEKEKDEVKRDLQNTDLDKYNIFTKYHAKGIIKAMHDGVPLILDEMNAIDPWVLTELNYYLTRKVWDKIMLPNGLGSFVVKDGFCIIATGNDPTANIKKEMYASRYELDQALINRMRTIDKNYPEQIDSNYTTNTTADKNLIREVEETIPEYLSQNEIYGLILMFLFDKKGGKSEFSRLVASGKAWFEVMKESFIGETPMVNKKNFFSDLKHLAVFVKKIQDAFQKKTVFCEGVDIGNLINSRVLSMRQLKEIVKDYQSDTKSLFYHIYNRFLSNGNGNENERRWMIYALKASDLLPWKFEWTLSLEEWKLWAVEKELHTVFVKEKTPGNIKPSLLNMHNPKVSFSNELLDSKLLLTKQDLYEEYFRSELDDIDDEMMKGDEYTKFKEVKMKENSEESDQNWGIEENQISLTDVKELSSELKNQLEAFENASQENNFLDSLPFEHYQILEFAARELSETDRLFSNNELSTLYEILNKILNAMIGGAETLNENDFTQLSRIVWKK